MEKAGVSYCKLLMFQVEKEMETYYKESVLNMHEEA